MQKDFNKNQVKTQQFSYVLTGKKLIKYIAFALLLLLSAVFLCACAPAKTNDDLNAPAAPVTTPTNQGTPENNEPSEDFYDTDYSDGLIPLLKTEELTLSSTVNGSLENTVNDTISTGDGLNIFFMNNNEGEVINKQGLVFTSLLIIPDSSTGKFKIHGIIANQAYATITSYDSKSTTLRTILNSLDVAPNDILEGFSEYSSYMTLNAISTCVYDIELDVYAFNYTGSATYAHYRDPEIIIKTAIFDDTGTNATINDINQAHIASRNGAYSNYATSGMAIELFGWNWSNPIDGTYESVNTSYRSSNKLYYGAHTYRISSSKITGYMDVHFVVEKSKFDTNYVYGVYVKTNSGTGYADWIGQTYGDFTVSTHDNSTNPISSSAQRNDTTGGLLNSDVYYSSFYLCDFFQSYTINNKLTEDVSVYFIKAKKSTVYIKTGASSYAVTSPMGVGQTRLTNDNSYCTYATNTPTGSTSNKYWFSNNTNSSYNTYHKYFKVRTNSSDSSYEGNNLWNYCYVDSSDNYAVDYFLGNGTSDAGYRYYVNNTSGTDYYALYLQEAIEKSKSGATITCSGNEAPSEDSHIKIPHSLTLSGTVTSSFKPSFDCDDPGKNSISLTISLTNAQINAVYGFDEIVLNKGSIKRNEDCENITVNGGSFTELDASGTATITGGTVTILKNSGIVTISGGTISKIYTRASGDLIINQPMCVTDITIQGALPTEANKAPITIGFSESGFFDPITVDAEKPVAVGTYYIAKASYEGTFIVYDMATTVSNGYIVYSVADFGGEEIVAISTASELTSITDMNNYYYLTNDITISQDFSLGTINAPFVGVFDGNGYSVTFSTTVSGGLFAYTNGATIKNVVVSGTISARAGGIMKEYNDTISMAGGVVDHAVNTTIENCIVDAVLVMTYNNSGNYYGGIGGIVGVITSSESDTQEETTIKNCQFAGTLSYDTSAQSGYYAGGIVALIGSKADIDCCILNYKTYGVTETNTNVGLYIGAVGGDTPCTDGDYNYDFTVTLTNSYVVEGSEASSITDRDVVYIDYASVNGETSGGSGIAGTTASSLSTIASTINSVNSESNNLWTWTDCGHVEGFKYISTAEELTALSTNSRSGTKYKFMQIVLNDSITIGSNWAGIANFYGSFDGNNNTLKLTGYCGLFEHIFGTGTIENLIIEGTFASGGNLGSISNYVFGENVTIRNCINYAGINCNGSTPYAGGFVGQVANSGNKNAKITVIDSQNFGKIATIDSASTSSAGGIVGYGYQGCTITVDNCYVRCRVNARYCGGVVGYSDGTNTIKNCIVDGYFEANGTSNLSYYAGGIMGSASTTVTTTITNCVVFATVYSYHYASGITYAGKGLIQNCYVFGDILTLSSATSYVHAFTKSANFTVTNGGYNARVVAADNVLLNADSTATNTSYTAGVRMYSNTNPLSMRMIVKRNFINYLSAASTTVTSNKVSFTWYGSYSGDWHKAEFWNYVAMDF